MYSLSRVAAVNEVVSPFPNHRLTLKPFSNVINLRNFNTLPTAKLKMSSSLNPNFVKQNYISLTPNFVRKNSSTLITELVKRCSFFLLKIMTVYKCIFETVVQSKFRVGDHITTTVDVFILRRAVTWKYDKDFEIGSIYVFWNHIKEERSGLVSFHCAYIGAMKFLWD
ncbi:hypothetical protein MKX03_033664 [Papaver bracteatum]|nr:hypothetical protein MKX03_033664 [Papaver bracteatum]